MHATVLFRHISRTFFMRVFWRESFSVRFSSSGRRFATRRLPRRSLPNHLLTTPEHCVVDPLRRDRVEGDQWFVLAEAIPPGGRVR